MSNASTYLFSEMKSRRSSVVRKPNGERPSKDSCLDARLVRAMTILGNERVAEFLDVVPSQLSNKRVDIERLSSATQRRLLDLDYVVAIVLQLFPREQAKIWLLSHNAHLAACPLDVLRLHVEAEGAYV
jgi:hypothetical protein